jgi:hypothetical protein
MQKIFNLRTSDLAMEVRNDESGGAPKRCVTWGTIADQFFFVAFSENISGIFGCDGGNP